MNAETRIFPAAVTASLNFQRPMAGRPVSYQYDPPPGTPQRTGEFDAHAVAIRNARPLAGALSLDVEGFALLQAPTGFADFQDDAAIRSSYYPEVERLLIRATGAAAAIAFDHNVRNAARAARGEAGIRGPVPNIHNDFTLRSGPERARRELEQRGLNPEALDGRRFAIVNLWRPIGRAVEKSPLVLGDARTIAAEDLVTVDLVYRDRTGETWSLRHNPAQRWYYFPRLTPDEAILIKSYESSPEAARFSPHAAFDDPTSPPCAPERESIEVRALVIYAG
ncbi:MAG: hypothetical protein JO276_17135 [Sphingomonadaceae bacterium]|nr:hypothetical protein [Sphingomonadaceae bacterium]